MMQVQFHSPFATRQLLPAVVRTLVCLSLLITIEMGFAYNHLFAQSGAITLYIPLIQVDTDDAACLLNAQEDDLVHLMTTDPRQQREMLTCDPTLSQVARALAEDMATRDYFDTVTPDGHGPNHLVRQAGYALPPYYSQAQDANNVASIAAGMATADQVWVSQSESQHLHGLTMFYEEQTDLGVGYAYNAVSRYQHYWVIITAQSAE